MRRRNWLLSLRKESEGTVFFAELAPSHFTAPSTEKAEKKIPFLRHIVSYGSMMKALIANNKCEDALHLYDDISKNARNEINHVIFVLALNACAKLKDLSKGKEIEETIREFDLYSKNAKNASFLLRNTTLLGELIHFYGECGKLQDVRRIWKDLKINKKASVASYGAMMKALVSNGENEDALIVYDEMAQFVLFKDV